MDVYTQKCTTFHMPRLHHESQVPRVAYFAVAFVLSAPEENKTAAQMCITA